MTETAGLKVTFDNPGEDYLIVHGTKNFVDNARGYDIYSEQYTISGPYPNQTSVTLRIPLKNINVENLQFDLRYNNPVSTGVSLQCDVYDQSGAVAYHYGSPGGTEVLGENTWITKNLTGISVQNASKIYLQAAIGTHQAGPYTEIDNIIVNYTPPGEANNSGEAACEVGAFAGEMAAPGSNPIGIRHGEKREKIT